MLAPRTTIGDNRGMRRRATVLLALASAMATAATACGDNRPATTGSLGIDPAAFTVPAGRERVIHATLRDDDVPLALGEGLTWSVREPVFAAVIPGVDGAVTVRGLAQGSTVITASLDGDDAQAALTVTAPEPVALRLEPAAAAVASGDCVQVVAHLDQSDGTSRDLDPFLVSWTASNGAIAAGVDGRYCPLGVFGVFAVWGQYGELIGTAPIEVVPAAVTEVGVFTNGVVAVGGQTEGFAFATRADGSSEDVTLRATWASSDPARLTATGPTLRGVALGTVTVSATFEGFTGMSDLEVVPPSIIDLMVEPSPLVLAVGATTAMTAREVWDDGSTPIATGVIWDSTNDNVVTIDASGIATAVAVGSAFVTARHPLGFFGFAQVTVE